MALANYGNLKDEVGAWLGRTDLVSTKVPDFITMATARLNRMLRCREMLSAETSVTADSNGRITIPADFVQLDYLRGTSQGDKPLANNSIFGGFDKYPPGYQSSKPYAFSITGATIQLFPPVANAALVMRYYQAIPAFTNDASTNWVLTKHPDLYLYAAILAGRGHVNSDASDLATVKAAYDEAIAELNADAINQEWAAGNVNASTQPGVI